MAATLTAREPTTNHPRPGSQNACSKGARGIYSRASLAPLFSKVRQVETEADDCEGRLPPLFCTYRVIQIRFSGYAWRTSTARNRRLCWGQVRRLFSGGVRIVAPVLGIAQRQSRHRGNSELGKD